MKVTVMARIREGNRYPFVDSVWQGKKLKPGAVIVKDATGKKIEVKRDDVSYYLRYTRHGKQVTEPAGKKPKDVLTFRERIIATAPVRRLQIGDRIVFYSPRERMEGGESTPSVHLRGEDPGRGSVPGRTIKGLPTFRRKTEYFKSKNASVRPLLEELSFTKGRSNWGAALRLGIFQMKREDYMKIAIAMGITFEESAD